MNVKDQEENEHYRPLPGSFWRCETTKGYSSSGKIVTALQTNKLQDHKSAKTAPPKIVARRAIAFEAGWTRTDADFVLVLELRRGGQSGALRMFP